MDTQKCMRENVGKALVPLQSGKVIVGAKQMKKALVTGRVKAVFLAQNADPALTEPIEAICRQQNIHCTWVHSKIELGQACGIDVGAAAAAVVD